jgi:4-oxalmesaconate hydratase
VIIDAHAHLFAPASLYAYRSNLVAARGQYGFYMGDVAAGDLEKFASQNVAIMNGVGTDLQILSPRPYLMMHGEHRWDDLPSSCTRHASGEWRVCRNLSVVRLNPCSMRSSA